MNKDQAPPIAFILGAALMNFTWTVNVPVPGQDQYQFAKLPLEFVQVDQAQLDKFRGIGLAEGEALPSDADIVRRVVVGWPDLKNAAGEPVPFSPEALEQLMLAPIVRSAIVATYMAAMSGGAARKNG
ncbi:phage tail assembly chaperone [Paucibacter sp. Y2R2-4]|uniref:phage tail assembly chaperone n=1 Tax=Paucibacter sp. Y2R2-4 TaxID=2893553 RepID=UPI0021E396EB|nr:phage tail assembly chaperone [Paucibacter sp. Y2R2-4]MCV2349339.1 phage tail assembly chaperone [Paucibacter sp. Y2R2-4]